MSNKHSIREPHVVTAPKKVGPFWETRCKCGWVFQTRISFEVCEDIGTNHIEEHIDD